MSVSPSPHVTTVLNWPVSASARTGIVSTGEAVMSGSESSGSPSVGSVTAPTVTTAEPVLMPETDVAVIVVVPAFLAVTTPASTVATEVSLEAQVTFFSEALVGASLALMVLVSPTLTVVVAGESVTEVTGVTGALRESTYSRSDWRSTARVRVRFSARKASSS